MIQQDYTRQLRPANQITMPSVEQLHNTRPGSDFRLTYRISADDIDEMQPEGDAVDGRVIDDMNAIVVGHLYFHNASRQPPAPPLANVLDFQEAHHELPVVVDPVQGCERPHLVLARFSNPEHVTVDDMDRGQRYGVTWDGCYVIELFTIRADYTATMFSPASHNVRKPTQNSQPGQEVLIDGVIVEDWRMVDFSADYQHGDIREVYRNLYRELRDQCI